MNPTKRTPGAMTVKYHGEIVLTLEDQVDQVFERYDIGGVTVLVDSTPEDDPDVILVHRLIAAAPELLEASQGVASMFEDLLDEVERLLRNVVSPAPCPPLPLKYRKALMSHPSMQRVVAAIAKAEGRA